MKKHCNAANPRRRRIAAILTAVAAVITIGAAMSPPVRADDRREWRRERWEREHERERDWRWHREHPYVYAPPPVVYAPPPPVYYAPPPVVAPSLNFVIPLR
jgi:hypothetical protein